MATITVRTRSGVAEDFEGREGLSWMENIRNAGHDELIAMCGGCLSCATCHVYVESMPDGFELPAMSIDEEDLLSGLDHRQENSRLSCQIPFVAAMHGIALAIAPEE
jgi:2Fe-2S ferredoxin